MPLVQTARGPLFYADHRKADSARIPVLLVHGAGDNRLTWPGALRRLPEANAIVPDLPGHGKSPGSGRNRVGDYAADMLALLDALDLPRVIVMGHSMGGAIGLTMALDYADRVAGLILMGSGARLTVHPNILDRILVAPDEVADLLKDWMWSEATPDDQRELTARQIVETGPEVVHGDYTACNHFDVRARLHEIRAPALVIGGTADKMTPYRYSQYLHEHLAGSTLVTIDGGGHNMALEQPQRVAEAVQEWLAAL